MKTTTKWILAALTAVAASGCDPFQEAVKGPPAVMSAGFTSVQDGTGYDGLPTTPGVVPVVDNPTPVPSTCMATGAIFAGDTGGSDPTGFIFVKFNKLLDGYSIQTSPTDCTPAAALGLSVTSTKALPADTQWYACYNPQAPSPNEGASIIVFLGPCSGPASATCTAPSPPPTGWDGALPIPTDGDVVTTLRATGTVHDQSGAPASFDVTVGVKPDPGTPGALDFSNITSTATNTDYDIGWAASQCAAATATYTIQRAPDNAGAPGTFADLATGLTALTYHDSVALNAIFWYRVRAVGTDGPSRWTAARTPKPAAPSAPTFANWTATSVDVNWKTTSSAVTYNVQRAPDVSNAPGTFADIPGATGLTGLTYTDSTLTASTKYWYRIVAVNPYGTTNGAYASQVPAQPAVPIFTNVTSTSLTVTWKSAKNAVTYTLQRAPDASGIPGTWANVALATGVTFLTFNDTGLTPATRYWYRVVAINPNAFTNGIAGFVDTTP